MDANINRSPSSYLLNPQSERDEYADEGDTDKNMLMLKFKSDEGINLGALNWFAVHGTSMNATNQVRKEDNVFDHCCSLVADACASFPIFFPAVDIRG